jgi:TolB-like protein/AraC-like DNA-binding protein
MNSSLSMDQEFIKKLTSLLEVNLEIEQFGVNELAEGLGISRSQLHRKLNAINGKSTSQFIREYRLKKAMEMLQKNVATASEIAYRVGFSSPTYFNTCFHEYYGFTPGVVKFKNPATTGDSEEIKTTGEVNISNTSKETNPIKKKTSKQRMILVSFLGIILLIAFSYYFYFGSIVTSRVETIENVISDKSIAVLPFKNLSYDVENEYFTDGMMEDILNHLSRIKQLKTISRTSSERYRDISKSLPEIANELGVSYVLEGSVQKYENKVRIIVQLIEARSDKHIWSENFDRELTDIFSIQSEIAKTIASKLSVVLTLEEIEQIDKSHTANLEAYNLYLLGRFHWNKRTNEGLETSIHYFEEAIKLDHEYGLAHAGLADTYNIMMFTNWENEKRNYCRDKAVELTLRALELDDQLAEAHTVLASVYTYYDLDWEEAEKEYLIAIKLNSNYPTVHHYFSEHLSVTGRHREARLHINKALELDPLSFIIHRVSSVLYFHQGLFDEALAEHLQSSELFNDSPGLPWSQFIINYWLGNDKEALEGFKKVILVWEEFKSIEVTAVDKIYQTSGLEGLCRLAIKRTSQINLQAQLYGLIGENEKALDLLEQAYLKHILRPEFTFDINYKHLHDHPRFIALQKKMGLHPSQLSF